MSRFVSLVLLWCRRACGASCKIHSFLKVSEEVAGSCCVPGMTVRDIPTCFNGVKSRSASFSEDTCMLHCRRSTLDVSCCVLLGVALSALRQTWAIVRGLVCAAGAAFGEVPLRVECHFV